MKRLLIYSYEEVHVKYQININTDVKKHVHSFWVIDFKSDFYYQFGERVKNFFPENFNLKEMIPITDEQFDVFKKIREITTTKNEWLTENGLSEYAI